MYQAAVVAYVRGEWPDADQSWFGWALPRDDDSEHVPMREYPPRLPSGGSSSADVEVGWVLIPRAALGQFYGGRGW